MNWDHVSFHYRLQQHVRDGDDDDGVICASTSDLLPFYSLTVNAESKRIGKDQ